MDLKKFFEKIKEKKDGIIKLEDLMRMTTPYNCRKVLIAAHLVNEGLITAEEAVESIEKENGFFILSNN
ncbi:MAG: hypothetical protein WC587_02335 [Candidatus Paceibacterota bacterium]